MKKILLLFTLTGLLTLTGCNNDDDVVVANTSNETFEVGPINFTAAGEFTSFYPLEPRIGNSDVILIYRLTGVDSSTNEDIWEPVPASYSLEQGTINYNTDFSVSSIAFYLDANFDVTLAPQYSLNQYFKVVILKGFDNSARIDFSDYNKVVKQFNVVESNRGNSTRK